MHLKKHFVKAHASSSEPEAALDLAIDKVEHQVATASRSGESLATTSGTRTAT